jgi:hypothetical protein
VRPARSDTSPCGDLFEIFPEDVLLNILNDDSLSPKSGRAARADSWSDDETFYRLVVFVREARSSAPFKSTVVVEKQDRAFHSWTFLLNDECHLL